ncbi:MAG TPA: citrate/2-methylcitrate synthase [Dehalococcoidia bacterium]|nr:citrate/2-methylcitrate synthase [Dehalococcoidia bacterium]
MNTLARGLKDVILDQTETSFIDGEVGKLLYRGYSIHDLAERSTFEEVTFLLLYKRLPRRKELEDLSQQLRRNRAIPQEVTEVIRRVRQAHPMDVLRTAVSALAAFDPDVGDNSLEANLRKSVRLTAQFPTIIAAHARLREGQETVAPNPKLDHAANFLYMFKGVEPDPQAARAMDIDFILHAEHGSNASAFAGRVTASTLADLHSAIVAAIATLKGPLHGGAAEAVMRVAEEIGDPERTEGYVKDLLARGERIMGFGHRVYKSEDPRARHLRDRSRVLGEKFGQPQWFKILSKIEEVMSPLRAKGIYVNVDFYAGSIYALLGIPEDLFIPLFAIGRMPGWAAQILEQYADNLLIRPLLKYVGPMDVEYTPLEQR